MPRDVHLACLTCINQVLHCAHCLSIHAMTAKTKTKNKTKQEPPKVLTVQVPAVCCCFQNCCSALSVPSLACYSLTACATASKIYNIFFCWQVATLTEELELSRGGVRDQLKEKDAKINSLVEELGNSQAMLNDKVAELAEVRCRQLQALLLLAAALGDHHAYMPSTCK